MARTTHPVVGEYPGVPFASMELRTPVTQIADFLDKIGFEKTIRALKKEAEERRVQIDVPTWRTLSETNKHGDLLSAWRHGSPPPFLGEYDSDSDDSESDEAEGGAIVDDEAEVTSDDSSDENSVSEEEVDVPAKAGEKRKRALTPSSTEDSSSDSGSDSDSDADAMSDSSSSSDSDSSSESSGDERPSKRTKVSHDAGKAGKASKAKASSDSEEDEVPLGKKIKRKTNEDSEDDEAPLKKKTSQTVSEKQSKVDAPPKKAQKPKVKSKESSDSDSSSSSGSDSESGSSVSSKSASSDSSSESDSGSSSSSSDDSSDSEGDKSSGISSPTREKSKKSASKGKSKAQKASRAEAAPSKPSSNSSGASSATLVGDKPPPPQQATETLLVPDANSTIGTKSLPATKENLKKLKKEQVPFSRIPANQQIDPRFSSNKYVSYDYADRAYNDLVVTKGKGFTKEKNKKKRGKLNTDSKPEKPEWKRRLDQEYAGLLDSDFYDEPGFDGPEDSDDYNPLGFKDDLWDFMTGCEVEGWCISRRSH